MLGTTADLTATGQKNQDIPLLLLQGTTYRKVYRLFDTLLRWGRQVTDIHRVGPPLTTQAGGLKQAGDALTIEGGRHHQQAQILAQPLLGIAAQGQGQIAVQITLMEFIEDHQTNTAQLRVLLQTTGQDPFSHYLDAGLFRYLTVQTHPVANRFAHRLPQLACHVGRRCTRGEASGFQHQDSPAP